MVVSVRGKGTSMSEMECIRVTSYVGFGGSLGEARLIFEGVLVGSGAREGDIKTYIL